MAVRPPSASCPAQGPDESPAVARLRAIGLPWVDGKLAVGPEILPVDVRMEISAGCRALLAALDLIYQESTESELCSAVGLRSLATLVGRPVPTVHWAAIARADVVMSGGRPRIIELNIASHAALFAVHDLLMEAQKPIAGWLRESGVESAEVDTPGADLGRYIGQVLHAHGSNVLAIAYPAAETSPAGPYKGFHYQALAELVQARGHEVACVPLESLTINDRGVWLGTRRIGAIYRYFAADPERPAPAVARVLRCAMEANVGLITPFIGDLLSSKSLLAHASSELVREKLGGAQAAALARCVPSTIIATRDTAPRLLSAKDDFVLKKSRGFGGCDVVVGRDIAAREWEAAVERATGGGDIWVAQQFMLPDPAYSIRRMPTGEEIVDDGPAVYGALLLEGRLVGVVKRQYPGASSYNVNGSGGALPNPVVWCKERS